jgi:cysteine desulfurase
MIYLDYNATTPIDYEVAKNMEPLLYSVYGNCSSSHGFGLEAKKFLEEGRQAIATALGAETSREIIFTSGGSESNNLAIKGIMHAYKSRGNHVITTNVEHPAVLEVCRYLESEGSHVTYLPVDQQGQVTVQQVLDAITPQTVLVTIMHANNETGVIQPIGDISRAVKAVNKDIIIHTDAAQSIGKVPVNVTDLAVDLLTIVSQKMYGPKGVGALYIRSGVKLEKQTHGAGHEHGIRPGTESVLLITGLAKACEKAVNNLRVYSADMKVTRDRLQAALISKYGNDVLINGHAEHRLPNTLNISFKGLKATELLHLLAHKVAASPGAACHSDHVTVSHVLQAMQVPSEYASGTVRFSTGRETTREQIDTAVQYIIAAVDSLRLKQ